MKNHQRWVDWHMNEGMENPSPTEEQLRLQRFIYAMQIGTPRLWVTQVIVAINIAVYLWMVLTGYELMGDGTNHPFLESGANYGPRTIGQGESWRLLTSMFLHGPIYHIGLNMWILWLQGKLVERLMGNSNFAIMYLASGLMGSLASVYMNPGVPSIGASGAIFGVIGALAALLYRHRAELPKEMRRKLIKDGGLFVIANLAFGAAIPNIDHAAHIGGLVAGLASGWFLAHPMSREGIAGRTMRGLKLSVGCAILLVLGGNLYPVERMNVPLGKEEMRPHIETLDTLRAESADFGRKLNEDRLKGTITADAAATMVRMDLVPRWEKYRDDVRSAKPSTDHGEKLRNALVAYAITWVELSRILALDTPSHLINQSRIETLADERDEAETRLLELWQTR